MTQPDAQEAINKRFEQVASTEYPFEKPERKLPVKHRVNIKSFKNVQPLLVSGVSLLFKISRPPLFIASLCLVLKSVGRWRYMTSCWSVALFIGLLRDVFFMHWLTDGRAGLGSGAKEGIYCKESPRNVRISERLQRFVAYRPTPYLWSGDLLTFAPFLLFKGSVGGRVNYQRWWVKVPTAKAPDGAEGPFRRAGADDDEAVALDIAFPSSGHRPDRPVFLVLHGLNGGSTEPYVLDLARQATKEGSTVAVMVARGLMKTPVRGYDSFTGARTSDVAAAVDVLLHGLSGEKRDVEGGPKKTRIILVGFSMGGIIAANYAAKAQNCSGLAGAVCFSGTLCSEKMLLPLRSAVHSLQFWQPVLAWGLKATIVKPNEAKLASRGITAHEVEQIKTVVDIDTKLVCKYHGYDNVREYYADMSAGGAGDDKGLARLAGTKVPLLAVHAIDDPIAVFEVTLPDKIAKTDNVILLATKHGGHIGWPRGFFPSKERWSFMLDIAADFAAALEDA